MTERELIVRAEATIAAWNRHDIDAIVAAFSPDARFRDASSRPAGREIGHPSVRVDADALFTAFPDMQLEIRRTLGCGAAISQEWTLRGTHVGQLMDVPPSGCRIEQDGIFIADYDSAGQIVAFTRYWNFGGLLAQLREPGPSSPNLAEPRDLMSANREGP